MFSSGIESVRGICCCDSYCCTDSLPSVAWALGIFSSGIEGFLGSDLVSSAAGGRAVSDSAFAMLLGAALRLCVEAGVSFTLGCFSSSIAADRSVGILYSSAASPPSSCCWLSCYTDSNFIELCFFFSETSVSCGYYCFSSSSTITGTCSWLLLTASTSCTSGCATYLTSSFAGLASGTSLVSSRSMPLEAA